QLYEKVTGSCLQVIVGFAEDADQFTAFTLEKKLDQHRIRVVGIDAIEIIQAGDDTVSSFGLFLVKIIEPAAVICIDGVMNECKLAAVDVFCQVIPVAQAIKRLPAGYIPSFRG